MDWDCVIFMALMLVILSLDTFAWIQFKKGFSEHSFWARPMLDAGQTEESDMAPAWYYLKAVDLGWPSIWKHYGPPALESDSSVFESLLLLLWPEGIADFFNAEFFHL